MWSVHWTFWTCLKQHCLLPSDSLLGKKSFDTAVPKLVWEITEAFRERSGIFIVYYLQGSLHMSHHGTISKEPCHLPCWPWSYICVIAALLQSDKAAAMANSQVNTSDLSYMAIWELVKCHVKHHVIIIYTIFPIFSNHSNLYIEESQIGKVHAGKAVGGTWVKDPCPHKGSNNLCWAKHLQTSPLKDPDLV